MVDDTFFDLCTHIINLHANQSIPEHWSMVIQEKKRHKMNERIWNCLRYVNGSSIRWCASPCFAFWKQHCHNFLFHSIILFNETEEEWLICLFSSHLLLLPVGILPSNRLKVPIVSKNVNKRKSFFSEAKIKRGSYSKWSWRFRRKVGGVYLLVWCLDRSYILDLSQTFG